MHTYIHTYIHTHTHSNPDERILDKSSFGAKFLTPDLLGAPLARLKLNQKEIDQLWDAIDFSNQCVVSYGDVAAFLAPSEQLRRYACMHV